MSGFGQILETEMWCSATDKLMTLLLLLLLLCVMVMRCFY